MESESRRWSASKVPEAERFKDGKRSGGGALQKWLKRVANKTGMPKKPQRLQNQETQLGESLEKKLQPLRAPRRTQLLSIAHRRTDVYREPGRKSPKSTRDNNESSEGSTLGIREASRER